MDQIKEAMIQADDARRDTENWNGKHQRACIRIQQLETAICQAVEDLPPVGVGDGEFYYSSHSRTVLLDVLLDGCDLAQPEPGPVVYPEAQRQRP